MSSNEEIVKVGKKCCIKDCQNGDLKDKGLHFHLVLRKNQHQTDQWIKQIRKHNGLDWNPTKHTKICGDHFVSGQFSSMPDHPDYVPTLFANDDIKAAKDSDVARFDRRILRNQPDAKPKMKDQSTMTETVEKPKSTALPPRPAKEFRDITKQVNLEVGI